MYCARGGRRKIEIERSREKRRRRAWPVCHLFDRYAHNKSTCH